MKMSISSIGNWSNMIDKLHADKKRQATEDCLQLIMNSTQVGYMQRKSPDGEEWKDNPEWYSQMKGGAAPLTGPITSKIKGGEFEGVYKFAKVNRRRMKNSLIKKLTSDTSGFVEYSAAAKERAELTQNGGKSEMELIPISTSSPYDQTLVFNIEIIERPHLGVAEYPRVGDKTDAEWIEYYFGQVVGLSIGEVK